MEAVTAGRQELQTIPMCRWSFKSCQYHADLHCTLNN